MAHVMRTRQGLVKRASKHDGVSHYDGGVVEAV